MDESILIAPIVLIGLPWLILHYITRWKTAATITSDDEVLLDELYQLARRLDERMDTVERLVASDHAEFVPTRLQNEQNKDAQQLRELEKLIDEKQATSREKAR